MLMKQIHSKPFVGKRLGRYICWWTKRSLGYHQHSTQCFGAMQWPDEFQIRFVYAWQNVMSALFFT